MAVAVVVVMVVELHLPQLEPLELERMVEEMEQTLITQQAAQEPQIVVAVVEAQEH